MCVCVCVCVREKERERERKLCCICFVFLFHSSVLIMAISTQGRIASHFYVQHSSMVTFKTEFQNTMVNFLKKKIHSIN